MKPTREIIGLRIISISDGTQVGIVKDLVLNPQGKTLDFMMVDRPSDYLGAKVIAFKDILGMGEFAVTIPYLEVIQDVAQNAEAQNLLKQDIQVLGTKVLTKKGQLIGEVKEVLIDEETGKIAVCLFESDGEMHEIGVRQIITLGKEILIVEGPTVQDHQIMEQSSENQIHTPDVAGLIEAANLAEELDFVEAADSAGELEFEVAADSAEELDFVEAADSIEELDLDTADSAEGSDFVEELDYIEEPEPEPEPVREPETGFNLFEQRQLQYFIDKMVEKDIILDNGEILRAGELITPEVVTHITTRSTLMEVTSHLRKN